MYNDVLKDELLDILIKRPLYNLSFDGKLDENTIQLEYISSLNLESTLIIIPYEYSLYKITKSVQNGTRINLEKLKKNVNKIKSEGDKKKVVKIIEKFDGRIVKQDELIEFLKKKEDEYVRHIIRILTGKEIDEPEERIEFLDDNETGYGFIDAALFNDVLAEKMFKDVTYFDSLLQTERGLYLIDKKINPKLKYIGIRLFYEPKGQKFNRFKRYVIGYYKYHNLDKLGILQNRYKLTDEEIIQYEEEFIEIEKKVLNIKAKREFGSSCIFGN